MEKSAKQGSQGSVAGRSGCGVSEAEQTDLRWIQRQTGKLVNTKAILRVMRKLNLLSAIRRRRHYTRYQQAIHKYPNLLNRSFDQAKPNQFWVTDITYIPISDAMLYMCAVLKSCSCVENRR